jgi:hypothetical protein
MEFTYLIGAGASAQTIPVISNFASELFNFANYIENSNIFDTTFPSSYQTDASPLSLRVDLIDDIKWLANECTLHSSVDTFARKLYLSNRNIELLKLKTIVSEFLLIKQIKNGIDKRYDAFFAALLEKDNNGLKLPSNIKIASWNYDKQIEYSISQFLNHSQNNIIENFIQLSPREEGTGYEPNSFCLFKLNGTVGGTISNNNSFIPLQIDYNLHRDKLNDEIEKSIILGILQRYFFIKQRIIHYGSHPNDQRDDYPTIIYSWERNSIFDRVRLNAMNATKNTEILVIIGYSFPTFNRTVDKSFLHNMGYLQKVFIQSPSDTIKGVVQRFKSLYEYNTIEIIPVENVDEFYIPYEF